MKKLCKSVQVFALVALAASLIAAAFVPAMYYVAAASMALLAVAAVAEPGREPACPRVFTREYRAQKHAA